MIHYTTTKRILFLFLTLIHKLTKLTTRSHPFRILYSNKLLATFLCARFPGIPCSDKFFAVPFVLKLEVKCLFYEFSALFMDIQWQSHLIIKDFSTWFWTLRISLLRLGRLTANVWLLVLTIKTRPQFWSLILNS